jgi:membrane protein YdbS with pleckstrin-like domain
MSDTTTSTTLRAAFNPLIRPYLVLTIGLTMIASIILLPFAVIWFLGLGQWWARHYFAKLECELTDKAIRFRKGILVTVEKTIPLENIQDVTFIEGPILRHFNLSKLKFETAGTSHNGLANMELTGIIDAQTFRNQILAKRDQLKERSQPLAALAPDNAQLIALNIIISKLDEIITHQKSRNGQ